MRQVPYKIMLVSLRTCLRLPSDHLMDTKSQIPAVWGLLREERDCSLKELPDLADTARQEIGTQS